MPASTRSPSRSRSRPPSTITWAGVLTDGAGRSTLDGLWACGECTSTGAHGANRLASNSLLEAVAFAARVAADIAEHLPQAEQFDVRPATEDGDGADADPAAVMRLRRTMSGQVGVVRDRAGLTEALAVIADMSAACRSPRLLNMLTAARMITAAALARTESRGGHYRSDFPEHDPAWRHRTFMTLAEAEAISEKAASIGAATVPA